MKQKAIFNVANCIASLAQARPDIEPRTIASHILAADKLSRQIRKRYENGCNYAWATTDAYQKRTDKLEKKLEACAKPFTVAIHQRSNVVFEFQRDPRGNFLNVHFERQTFQLGGF